MNLTKEFVNSCRKVGVLRDFLCQAIDQVDERDKQIAELKSDIQDLQDDRKSSVKLIDEKNATIAQLEDDVAFWKKKLEDVQASMYAESVDAGMRERKLKRALYKACANWAHFAVAFFSSYATKECWYKMERKCRAKAEEYK